MPVISGKTRTAFLSPRLCCRGLVVIFFLVVLGPFATAVRAQTIRIKLVNGRNGRPMARTWADIWVGDKSTPSKGPLFDTQTDDNGVIRLTLTREDAEVNIQKQERRVRGLINPIVISPVLKYGDTVSIRSGLVLCQFRKPDHSWLTMLDFSTNKVLQSGVVTANACGRAKAPPTPGEIVVFVRPLTLWEKLKQ